MTQDEIQARVLAIQNVARDFEVAHSMEDELHRDVLQAIANGTLDCDPRIACSAALSSRLISFARHCA